MGHSFAHCALHLIYFRLYSIADRSKSHRVLCGWLMWIQLYDRPIDRSNESHRSPFNVNLRWSLSRFDQSVASLFRAPIIESFSSPPPPFFLFIAPWQIEFAYLARDECRSRNDYSSSFSYFLLQLVVIRERWTGTHAHDSTEWKKYFVNIDSKNTNDEIGEYNVTRIGIFFNKQLNTEFQWNNDP